MRDYIKRNGLMVLGFTALAAGIVLQASTGRIDGSVLFPLPIIYAALRLREGRKTA